MALDTRFEVGRHGVGLAARQGLTLSDIRTPGALKRPCLPRNPWCTSTRAQRARTSSQVLSRLGITTEVANVLRGYGTSDLEAALRARNVTAGVATLRALPGAGEAAPLSDELQSYTAYTVAVSTSARTPAAARALCTFSSSAASQVLIAHGLEPVPR